MTDAHANLSVAEMPLEIACERVDPNAFDGLSVAMQGVELATALRVAEVLPVGGLVAGAGTARLLNEGFEQDRTIGVAGMPVGGLTPADQGEDSRSKVFAVDPRQDEKTGVIDDEMQAAPRIIGACRSCIRIAERKCDCALRG